MSHRSKPFVRRVFHHRMFPVLGRRSKVTLMQNMMCFCLFQIFCITAFSTFGVRNSNFIVMLETTTELVLVLVQQCFQECSVFPNGSEHNSTVKCNRMKSQKVRRRPESCHSYHPKVSPGSWTHGFFTSC